MPTRAGAVWLDVLPSLASFGPAVMAGTRVPLAAAGRAAGAEYSSSLVAATSRGLNAMSSLVGREAKMSADQMAKAVESAESRVRVSRAKAEDSAGKLRVAEMKLAELREKDGVSGTRIAKAEANVAKIRATSTRSNSELALAEAKLSQARGGESVVSEKVVAATAKLGLAREAEVAKTGAVNVAAAKLADLRAKEAAQAEKTVLAEQKVARSREAVERATKALADVQAKTGGQASDIEANAQAIARAEKAVADAEKQAAAAARELKAARDQGVPASKIAEAEEKLAAAERNAATASDGAKKAAAELSSAQKKAGDSATVAQGKFAQFRQSVDSGTSVLAGKVGGFAKATAGMAGVFGGFQLAHFAGESTKAAMEFQRGSNVLVTAAGESTKNLGMVQKGLLDISSQTGTSTEQMTEGMYTVEKAGYRGAKGLDIMRAAAMGARDEGADLGVVTNGLTSIMQSSNGKITSAKEAMNGLMVAAGSSKTTLQDFTGSLSSVLPVSSKLGLSFAEVTGALGTMTASGMSAQQAAQNLNHVISSLAAPTQVQANEMAAFGLSAQDVRDNLGKRGLQGTIELLSGTIKSKLGPAQKEAAETLTSMPAKYQDMWASLEQGTMTVSSFEKKIAKAKDLTEQQKNKIIESLPASQGYAQAMKKMTGGIVGLNVSMMTTGASAEGFKKRTEEIGHAVHSTDDFTKKWGMTQKTASASLAIAKQTIHNAGTELAMNLLPALALGAKWFTTLTASVVRFVRQNWTGIKVAGGILLGVVAAVKAYSLALAAAQAAMTAYRTVTTTVATAQTLLSIATGRATAAQVTSFTATKSGAIAMRLYNGVIRAAAAAQWVWNAAMEGNPIVLVITGLVALGVAMVVAYKKSQTFRNIVQGAWEGIKSAAGAVVGWFTGTAWPLLHKGLDEVGAAAMWLWHNAFQPAMNGIAAAGQWMWNNALKPAFSALAAAGKAIWDHGLKPAFSALSTAIDFVGKHWKVFATILAIPLTPIIVPLVGVFKLLQAYGMTALRAVGSAAMWLWNVAIGPAFRAAGALGMWLWNAALKPALGGIETGARKAGNVATWLWNVAIGPSFRAIGALGAWLWNNALRPALNGIWGGMQTLAKGVQWVWQNGFSVAFHAIGALAQWLWHYAIGPMVVGVATILMLLGKAALAMWNSWFKPAFQWIGDKASWLWHHAIAPMASAVVGLLKDIGKWASWLWTNGIRPTFQWIGDKASWLWNKAIRPAASAIVGGFKDLAKWGSWLWHNALKPAFDGIGSAIKWVWDRVVKPAFDAEVRGFKEIAKWADWLWKKGIKPAFDGLGAAIKWVYDHTISPVFSKFGDLIGRDDNGGLRKVFKLGVKAMGSVWDGLRAAIAKPINIVIGFVDDKFIGGFNSIASKVGVAKIPTIPKIPGYAAGGQPDDTFSGYTGFGGKHESRGIIEVHGNEYVQPSEVVAREGVAAMQDLHYGRATIVPRNEIPGFDKGGLVPGWLKSGASKAWNGAKGAAHAVTHAVTHPAQTAKSAEQAVTGTLSGDAMRLAKVVKFALQQVGKPYVWGAEGPGAFDCSGLVKAAYASGAGMGMDHFADTQLHMGRPVSRSHLQPGDLLGTIGGHPIPHVAMAITPDLMVQAANPRVGVIGPQPIPATLPAGARRLLGDVNATEVAGIVKGLGAIDFVKGAASAGMGALARTLLEPLRGVLKKPIDGLAGMFGKNNFVVDMAAGEAKHIVDGTIDWAEHMADSIIGGGAVGGAPGNYSPTGGIERWTETISQALTLNGITPTPDLIKRWKIQMGWESGGDPNAVQHGYVDVNTGGNEARGLVQVTPATFRGYHVAGTPNNIFDPLANLAAGVNWARHTYGASMSYIGSGSQHGYAGGTPYAAPGIAEVAEDGAEIVFGRQWRRFKGGEQVYNRAQLASLSKPHKAETAAGEGIHMTFNGVKYDAAADVAREVGFELKRLDYAGRYERAW